jgi:hypothetical protein
MHPAVHGLVHAAFFVGSISVAQSADVNDFCVVWIDHDAANLARFFQADVCPRRTAVNGFVDAVAGREAGTNIRL